MELTLRRWVALALGGAIVVAAAVFGIAAPTASMREERVAPARQEVRALRTALREAETTLAILEQRAWVQRELRQRTADIRNLTVLADTVFEPAVVSAVTALAESAWQQLPARASSLGVVLALLTDVTGSRTPGDARLSGPRRGRTFFAPALLGDSACLATIVVPVFWPAGAATPGPSQGPRPRSPSRDPWLGLLDIHDRRGVGLFGLCGWYAAFGNPGPAIQTWLFRTRHRMAANGPWMRSRDDDPERVAGRAGPRRRLTNLRSPLTALRYGFDALACAGDRAARCAMAVLRDAPDSIGPPVTGIAGLNSMPAQSGAFREVAGWWLADLFVDMGPDRFRRFWTSPHQVDVAFAEAFGLPLGEWTVGWARSRIGQPKLGPGPGVGETAVVGAWLTLAFAVVAWLRAHRRVR